MINSYAWTRILLLRIITDTFSVSKHYRSIFKNRLKWLRYIILCVLHINGLVEKKLRTRLIVIVHIAHVYRKLYALNYNLLLLQVRYYLKIRVVYRPLKSDGDKGEKKLRNHMPNVCLRHRTWIMALQLRKIRRVRGKTVFRFQRVWNSGKITNAAT